MDDHRLQYLKLRAHQAIHLVFGVQVLAILVFTAMILSSLRDSTEGASPELISISNTLTPLCLLAMSFCPLVFLAVIAFKRHLLTRNEKWLAVAVEMLLLWFEWEWLIRPCTNI